MPRIQDRNRKINTKPFTKIKKRKKTREFDSPWKLALDAYFEEFMAFCCPTIYREIDWTRGYKMLDKELNKITNKSFGGNQHVDKLIEVYLKNGQTTIILLHLEVQSKKQLCFPLKLK